MRVTVSVLPSRLRSRCEDGYGGAVEEWGRGADGRDPRDRLLDLLGFPGIPTLPPTTSRPPGLVEPPSDVSSPPPLQLRGEGLRLVPEHRREEPDVLHAQLEDTWVTPPLESTCRSQGEGDV